MSRALTGRQSARAGVALLVANARYWTTVAARTRSQLARWELRASSIPDPALQALACGELRRERFNVEVAATLATLAPRARRAAVTDALVALQVAYDYLDAVGEQRESDRARREDDAWPGDWAQPRDGAQPQDRAQPQDGGYSRELIASVKRTLSELPTAAAVADVVRRAARRCSEAQTLVHAAPRGGNKELERWATREAAGTGLWWPEFLAGASASVLALHALIAAAADPRTTREDAEAIDAAYLRIGALTMLDSLIDHEQDLAMGEAGYIRHYADREQMASRLAAVTRDAARRTRALRHGAHHTMTLVGVVSYYGSSPAARGDFARPVIERLREELRPLVTPTLAIMHAWRLAKSLRGAARRHTTTSYGIVSSTQDWRSNMTQSVLQHESTDQGRVRCD